MQRSPACTRTRGLSARREQYCEFRAAPASISTAMASSASSRASAIATSPASSRLTSTTAGVNGLHLSWPRRASAATPNEARHKQQRIAHTVGTLHAKVAVTPLPAELTACFRRLAVRWLR